MNNINQKQRSKILATKPKKAQEEMVGFGLIIAIVAIILLAFLWFSLTKQHTENLESYEVESFISSFLQYNTECENYRYGHLNVQDLIFYCDDEKICENGRNGCDILKETVNDIIEESWPIVDQSTIKGYYLNISVDGKNMINLEKGNNTDNSKGYLEDIKKSQGRAIIEFSAYY